MVRNIPDVDLDSVRAQIQRSISRKRPDSGSPLIGGTTSPEQLRLPAIHFIPPFEPNLRRSFHFRELARYHGREFVENAYLALLRHRPDPQGAATYCGMLQRGISKIEILLRLRLSPEGRDQRVRLRGLLLPLVLALPTRLPVLGGVFTLIGTWFSLPGLLREFRQNQELLLRSENETRARTERKINEIIHALDSREKNIHQRQTHHETHRTTDSPTARRRRRK